MKKIAALTAAMLLAASFGTLTVHAAGWEKTESGSWSYCREDGSRATGWLQSGGKWYYLDSSGNMKTKWVKANGKWYFMDLHGVMQTGFLNDGRVWYFLDGSGAWQEGAEDTAEALSATGKTMRLEDGVLYVDGILVANKTYPLPESYDPGGIKSEVMDAYNVMKKDMTALGMQLSIVSGYRSYDYQVGLYQRYVNRDGKAAADTYSARPGYSEHQTGLSFDVNYAGDAFTNTKEAKWLEDNAWKYGFIIRFPKGKEGITGYQYESWHLRYVGMDAAREMYEGGLCLEEYLGIPSYYLK